MKKNNKGFTLIELLAVIVVLAVIMVIATTQINRTIKKSRANTFYDSVLMIEKHAKMVCAQDNSMSKETIAAITDYNTAEYDFTVSGNDITVTPTADGKFDNVKFTDYYYSGNTAVSGKEKAKSNVTVSDGSMTILNPCGTTTSTQ